MQDFLKSFGIAVRSARKKRNYSQVELAQKLHMASRTILEVEQGRGNPRFETILLIACELRISIDVLMFPNTMDTFLPDCVLDYFSEKSEAACQKYIALCRQADALKDENYCG